MQHSTKSLPKLRIAIADDSSLNRMLWRTLFREWNPNIEIDEAKNGLQLVELVRENRYDVVLTDVMMPIMDGIEATKYIREFNPFVPIIGISGSNLGHEISTFDVAGMNSYITKPIEFSVLLKEIGKLIEVDLINPSIKSELSGLYSRIRKVSKDDEQFETLKFQL
ncbi:MAG: response regulator, partial [Flavobacteriales bacterium]|nr:response regulator [Flavobacteriales bacterium]